jgi:DNA repair exonuclease SbcCD ATPase subunit
MMQCARPHDISIFNFYAGTIESRAKISVIIKRVTIRDWRGISEYATDLQAGLNILRGPNEAGKSSIAEAIFWALHQDIVGGAQVKDIIAPILPFADARKRPFVELLLDFPDCSVTITKILAEDSAQRACRLTVHRHNQADQHFDQVAAQNELRLILARDGVSSEASSLGVDVPLLFSAQGEGTRFVETELSVEARAGIYIGENGAIAPTQRLAKLSTILKKQRKKELGERLRSNAVEAAKKATSAALQRESLSALRASQAEYSRIESQITQLRTRIAQLQQEHAQTARRARESQREWEQLRKRHNTQLVTSGAVAEKRRASEEARARRDGLQRTIADIALLRSEVARSQAEVQIGQDQLQTLRDAEVTKKAEADTAWEALQAAESAWAVARERLQAWDRSIELLAVRAERQRLRTLCEQRENFAQEVATKKAQIEKLGRVPLPQQIARWRNQHLAMEQQRRMAGQVLQLVAQPFADSELTARADDGEDVQHRVRSGEEVLLHGQSMLTLEIAGWGKIAVTTSGNEAEKQQAEVAAKRRAMEKELAVFGVKWTELPAAFDVLETRGAALALATQELQISERQLESATESGASGEELNQLLGELQAEYSRLRAACEPLRHHLPEEIKPSQAHMERERARENESARQRAVETARSAWQKLFGAHNQAASQLSAHEARLEANQTTFLQSSARLLELEREGGDDVERSVQLDEWNRALWRSGEELEEALRRLEAQGEAVNEEELAFVEHEANALRAKQHSLETELAEKRVALRGYCEQDPTTELDRIEFEIAEAEQKLARHEVRLRGMVVLEAALEAERHRLGRAITAPINEHLSPWLSALRGKPTRVEFDENTGRITGVLTKENASTHVLPFASHSGGMQEQTALALRLVLAQAAAKKLPSGRLPIVLDDPLTQSDAERGEGLWRALQSAAEHLQIVYVTCHEPAWLQTGEVNSIDLDGASHVIV